MPDNPEKKLPFRSFPTLETYYVLQTLGHAGLEDIPGLYRDFDDSELIGIQEVLAHVLVPQLYDTFSDLLQSRDTPLQSYDPEYIADLCQKAGAKDAEQLSDWYDLFKRFAPHIPFTPFLPAGQNRALFGRLQELQNHAPASGPEYDDRVRDALTAVTSYVETHQIHDDVEASQMLSDFLMQNALVWDLWDIHLPKFRLDPESSDAYSMLTMRPDDASQRVIYVLSNPEIIPVLEAGVILGRTLRVLEEHNLLDVERFQRTDLDEGASLFAQVISELLPEETREAHEEHRRDVARRLLQAIMWYGIPGYLELALNAGRDRYEALFSPTSDEVAAYNGSIQLILRAYSTTG